MVLLLFFLSGATSLTYQVLWVRELQLVFGTSTFAISTVLAAFMGGLSVGGFVMGRYADRLPRPLSTYGLLEIGIGLYAVVFPSLVALAMPAYLNVWRAITPGPVAFGAIQFVLIGSTLLVPTAAMGATLPLLARFRIRQLEKVGSRIGTLYSANTFGAVFGTWLCGFVLLPHVGRHRTTLVAVSANILLGLGALALSRRATKRVDVTVGPKRQTTRPGDRQVLTAVSVALALAGFSVLTYEVAWNRLLGLILGGSTYTFSLMLLVFLAGIGIGGKLGGRLADRLLVAGGRTRLLLAFAMVEVSIAILSYTTMYLYPELPVWYVWLFDWFNAERTPRAVWWVSIVVSALVMAPPTVLMGMHFPIAVRAAVTEEGTLGSAVGRLYGANTLGGVCGAFLAAFVLLPTIWMQGTIFVAALAGLTAAGVLLVVAGRGAGRLRTALGYVGLVALTLGLLFVARRPPWNPLLMTSGVYNYVNTFRDHTRAGIREYGMGLYTLLFYEEGLTNVVTVAQNKGSPHVWLANNGKVDASTADDMPTQVLLSAVPMQFVEAPNDVLIVGLASGISAGTVALSPAVKRLEIVEIEPAVERAATFFNAWNRNVLADPRVAVIHNDARNHLLLTPPGTYDVVISEPSNPWLSGVANLFTREFLQLGRSRLAPGGVWSQWIQTYGLDGADLRSLLRTFADVFPHVLVYTSVNFSDVVVVGSDRPMDISHDRTRQLLETHGVPADLVRVGVYSNVELASLFLMDRAVVMAMAGTAPLNTDDNMRIEYSVPLSLYRETRAENLKLLRAFAKVPDDGFTSNPEIWRHLADIYRQRQDQVRYEVARSRAE